MRFITSRTFDLPGHPEEMAAGRYFNLWSKRNWPYNELNVGDELYWYESRHQRLRWRTTVIWLDRFEYTSKSHVAERLGLSRADLVHPYYIKGPKSGFCLAYRVSPVELLSLPKPEGFRLPMIGWLRIPVDADAPWPAPAPKKSGQGIPDGLTRDHVLIALAELQMGEPHGFGPSTGYDLLHGNRRFPPKAVIGLAAAEITGQKLGPYDFKGGDESKCFRILRDLGFCIVRKWDEDVFPDEEPVPGSFEEGDRKRVLVNRYERDAGARAACIAHHGTKCLACGLSMETRYGALGAGYIQVHHVVPLSEVGGPRQLDPKTDLVPLCPNCHAMIHRGSPPLTVGQLRATIEAVAVSE